MHLTQLENSLCQLFCYQAHFNIQPTSSFKELRSVSSAKDSILNNLLTYLLTYQGHREFPFWNSREFPGIADPKIPGENYREFLKFCLELRGISRVLSFFPIFIVDYNILVFNLTAF